MQKYRCFAAICDFSINIFLNGSFVFIFSLSIYFFLSNVRTQVANTFSTSDVTSLILGDILVVPHQTGANLECSTVKVIPAHRWRALSQLLASF